MREINECTAEVFRRSEKRIKERRKNRNRVIALCIPLCLVVTVWSVMILPAMLPVGTDDLAEKSGMELVNTNEQSIYHSYVQVEIRNADSSPEYYHKVTDYSGVTEVFELIHDLSYDDGYTLNECEEIQDKTFANQDDYSTDTTPKYIITFTTADGAEQVYVLNGSELLVEGTGVRIPLSDEQLAELKTVLGLPQ